MCVMMWCVNICGRSKEEKNDWIGFSIGWFDLKFKTHLTSRDGTRVNQSIYREGQVKQQINLGRGVVAKKRVGWKRNGAEQTEKKGSRARVIHHLTIKVTFSFILCFEISHWFTDFDRSKSSKSSFGHHPFHHFNAEERSQQQQ